MFSGRFAGAWWVMSEPPSRIEPAVGRSKPATIRSVVVLPQPLGPSNEKNSPSPIERSRSSTTVFVPNVLLTPTISMVLVVMCSPSQ